jgi:hypothetical protein
MLAGTLAPPPAFSQNLLHIRILEGEGTILGVAARSPKGIVVEITDETGRPVEAAAVSFRMPEEGPGAAFARGMRTEIRTTTPDGRASVHDFTANRVSGPFQVRVTVVKNGVRAGTIISQYVSDAPTASKGMRSSRKWLTIIAVAGGAAAAGGVVAVRGGSPGSTSSTRAGAVSAGTPSIGVPSFTVGGP